MNNETINFEEIAKDLIENDKVGKETTTGDYPKIEDGVYPVIIEQLELRTASTGNRGINFKLRLDNNRLEFVTWYFDPRSAEKTVNRCMTLVKELGYEISADLFKDLATIISTIVIPLPSFSALHPH